jgi:bacterial/archaeal transporter family protein
MKWIWVLVVVFSSTAGDVANAKGMSESSGGDVARIPGVLAVFRTIFTHRSVLFGLACNVISFAALLHLLSIARLSFAVPATALTYILETFLARFYLRERVTCSRWIGVVLVASGIVLVSV